MHLFRRSARERAPSVPLARQVRPAGRTTPFSYHGQRSADMLDRARLSPLERQQAAQPRTVQPKARMWWRLLRGRVPLIAVLIIAAWYVLSLSPAPQVMVLSGQKSPLARPLATYQQAAAVLWRSSIFNYFKPTVATATVSTSLRHQFPELTAALVTVPLLGRRPEVELSIAQPAIALLTDAGRAYAIDGAGNAAAQVDPTHLGTLGLTPVKDLSGTPVTVGSPVLSSTTVSFITTILGQLALKHLSVTTFVLPAASSELDMYLTGSHYFVKFNLENQTALQQTGTFLAVQHALQSRGVAPATYIDVRIDGRAYYK